MRKNDIPENELNTVMSYKNFSAPSDQMTLGRVEGNDIHLIVKSMLNNTCKIDDERWSHAQMHVDTGIQKGMILHVNRSYAFDKSKEPTFVITLSSSIADLSKLVNGDKVHFEWDIYKLPKTHFTNKPYIVRAGLSGKQAGSTDLPPDLTNIFVQCIADNQEIPPGCEFHGGDMVPTSNRHLLEANNRLLYEVKKVDGYNIIDESPCLHQKAADAVGINTSPSLIPETKMSKNIIKVAFEEKEKAIKNNNETYNAGGQELINEEFTGGA